MRFPRSRIDLASHLHWDSPDIVLQLTLVNLSIAIVILVNEQRLTIGRNPYRSLMTRGCYSATKQLRTSPDSSGLSYTDINILEVQAILVLDIS